MKDTLKSGLRVARLITIDRPRTIDFLGDSLRVYATPELVQDIETTCREFLLEHCDVGEDSVGTGIRLSHSGATLLGGRVEITVTVEAVEGRKVLFAIVARDHMEEIARGEHDRFVVEIAKLRQRVEAKARAEA